MKISVKSLVETHCIDSVHTKKESAEAVKHFADIIHTLLQISQDSEDSEVGVTIPRLGTFTVKTRKARVGRNPRDSKQEIEIPESIALTFKQASDVKQYLNEK